MRGILPKFPEKNSKENDLKKTVCALILSAIFVNSKHIQRFYPRFHIFCPNSTDFARILTKSKVLGMRLHPLHPASYTSDRKVGKFVTPAYWKRCDAAVSQTTSGRLLLETETPL